MSRRSTAIDRAKDRAAVLKAIDAMSQDGADVSWIRASLRGRMGTDQGVAHRTRIALHTLRADGLVVITGSGRAVRYWRPGALASATVAPKEAR